MTLFAACLTLLAAYTLLMLYYRRGWRRIGTFQTAESHIPKTKVSVVVPARNEETHISGCLDGIVQQQYPIGLLETVVVDDGSTDDTAGRTRAFLDRGVRLIPMAADDSANGTRKEGKKKALESGIASTDGSLIVTTDADCTHPSRWVATLTDFMEKSGSVMAAAPVRYRRERSVLDVFQSLDFMTMQGITAVSVTGGLHAMANGANLAFLRDAYDKVRGYEGIDRIASGDDMMLMEKMWESFPGRVGYCLSREAVVETDPPHTLKGFLEQRVRWASKAAFYRGWRIRLILLLVYLFNLAMLAYMIRCLFQPQEWRGWLSLVLAKSIAELVFLWPVSGFFDKRRLLAWFLPLQPLHILYIVVSGFFGQIGTYTWKGRSVK
jgi:cellulose synthase/poly-beta-1,6-N-acetylglucosamine synthase-like glycosyltransferase